MYTGLHTSDNIISPILMLIINLYLHYNQNSTVSREPSRTLKCKTGFPYNWQPIYQFLTNTSISRFALIGVKWTSYIHTYIHTNQQQKKFMVVVSRRKKPLSKVSKQSTWTMKGNTRNQPTLAKPVSRDKNLLFDWALFISGIYSARSNHLLTWPRSWIVHKEDTRRFAVETYLKLWDSKT